MIRLVMLLTVLLTTACATPQQEAYRKARIERAAGCLAPYPQYSYRPNDRFGEVWVTRRDGRDLDADDVTRIHAIRDCMDYAGHLKSRP